MNILTHDGEGYKRLLESASWTVAELNYAQRFDEGNLVRLERHLQTDEVFVLLAGEATLVVGKECSRVRMEAARAYVIAAGEWHHILVKPGTHVLIVENANTGAANTDYLDLKK